MASAVSSSVTDRSPSSSMQTIESRFGFAIDLSRSLASPTLRQMRDDFFAAMQSLAQGLGRCGQRPRATVTPLIAARDIAGVQSGTTRTTFHQPSVVWNSLLLT